MCAFSIRVLKVLLDKVLHLSIVVNQLLLYRQLLINLIYFLPYPIYLNILSPRITVIHLLDYFRFYLLLQPILTSRHQHLSQIKL